MTGGWGVTKLQILGLMRHQSRGRENCFDAAKVQSQYCERCLNIAKDRPAMIFFTSLCFAGNLRAFQKGSLRFARFRLPPPNPIFKNMLAEGLNGRWWVISPKHIPCQPHPLLSDQPICGVGFCHAFHPSCFHFGYSHFAPEREKSISACPPLY